MSKTKPTAPEPTRFNPLALSVRMLAAGLKNADVAEALGLSGKTVAQWRVGVYEPPARHIKTMAGLLGCSVPDMGKGVRVVAVRQAR